MSVEPTSEELNSIALCAQKLWDLDDNKLDPEVDYAIETQGGTTRDSREDVAADRLFRSLDQWVWQRPTYRAFVALLDNYERRTGITERDTAQELAEQDAFLEAIVPTRPMQYLKNYLAQTNGGSTDDQEFHQFCRELWFPHYNRDAEDDSSGFEHVFVGESDSGRVSGFHSWIQFYREEQRGSLDYRGYITRGYGSDQPNGNERLLQLQLAWDGEIKSISTIIVGSSPEFDFALYTLYFIAGSQTNRAGLLDRNVEIRCYPIHGNNIGTCYVAVIDE